MVALNIWDQRENEYCMKSWLISDGWDVTYFNVGLRYAVLWMWRVYYYSGYVIIKIFLIYHTYIFICIHLINRIYFIQYKYIQHDIKIYRYKNQPWDVKISDTIKPYKARAYPKIRIKIIPTKILSCWALARTPASPTIPIASPAAKELNPQHSPDAKWA